jgi:tetratricopeptide (TPR) repeat protein
VNSRQTNNFFIHSSFSGISTALLQEQQNKKTAYYQRLIHALLICPINTFEGIDQLAERLATIARQAYLAREMSAVKYASQLMVALPASKKLKSIALYYEALCSKQQGDVEGAQKSFEQVVQEAIPQYKARALQNVGAIYHNQGEIVEALPFYLAAEKIAAGCDLVTLAETQRMIAVVRSINGDHKGAIDDLEKLLPLVRAVSK